MQTPGTLKTPEPMPEWYSRSACGPVYAKTGKDWWFGPDEDSPDYSQQATFPKAYADPARRVCAGCPVKQQCLSYAFETDQRDGIWGGLTPAQRTRRITKQQEAAKREVAA